MSLFDEVRVQELCERICSIARTKGCSLEQAWPRVEGAVAGGGQSRVSWAQCTRLLTEGGADLSGWTASEGGAPEGGQA